MTEQHVPTPPWVQALVDQRLALMEEKLGPAGALLMKETYGVVMSPLSEHGLRDNATKAELDRWDRSCDRCGVYVPKPFPFTTGRINTEWHGVQVILTFGACSRCAKETL